jgi:predicted nucleic acid-binding protein
VATVVVDTDVASYTHKSDSRVRLYQRHLIGSELVISFMTLAELDEWAQRRRWGSARRQRLERFLERFSVFYADRHLCSLWADIRAAAERKGRPIDKADAWTAAAALALGIGLVTNNSADYAGVDGLKLLTALTT